MDLRERRITGELRRSRVALEATTSDDKIYVTCPYGVFVIDHGYPFKPPKLLVTGEDHVMLLYKRTRNLRDFMKRFKLTDLCCCCNNLSCKWSPCYGLQEVMEEFVTFSKRINTLSRLSVVLANLEFDDCINSTIISYLW
jgi:ubiquitin-protein ligase